jgi:hypothetical protein
MGSPGALLRQTLATYQEDTDTSFTGVYQRLNLIHSVTA